MFWGFYYDIIRINLLSQICVDLRCFFLPGLQSNISSDLKSSCCLASKNDFFPLILTHRNYHVFYYLLLGVSEEEQQEFQLKQPEDYFYLNQVNSPNPGHKCRLCSPQAVYVLLGGQRQAALATSSPKTRSREAKRRLHKGAHSFPASWAPPHLFQPKSFSHTTLTGLEIPRVSPTLFSSIT